MENSLGRKFSFISLIMFALPNIIMMLFMSLYTIVDGMFVSSFVGTTALSAINMVFPIICLAMGFSIMLSTGGSAIVAKKMGMGDMNGARESFTLIISALLMTGIIFSALNIIFIDDILHLLGVSAAQMVYAKSYIIILLLFTPMLFLQTAFQVLFITAGKPKIGLALIVGAGLSNMLLDYIFIVWFNMGINGAALATVIGYLIPSLIGLLYFFINKKGSLYFVKFKLDFKMLLEASINGSSEMVANIANAVTTLLFNFLFMKFYLEDGVAAITIVLYFQFVFTAIYSGFALGVAPIISYQYGASNVVELKKVVRYSFRFIILASIISFLTAILTIDKTLSFFTPIDSNVYQITIAGFGIYACGFLFMGFSTFSSALFTALCNGKISAIISFTRTLLFLVTCLIVLPMIFGDIGLWLAVPVAEIMGFIMAIYFVIKKRLEYQY